MAELEIDLNQKMGEWDVITEAGSELTPLYGPGYTGIVNMGNSCYMNSVAQVLFHISHFRRKYQNSYQDIIAHAPNDPAADFTVQMSKLGHCLWSGDYSKQPEAEPDVIKEPVVRRPQGIKPSMFKSLVGKGHTEFSTKRQQDAEEYLRHLLQMTERHSRGSLDPTTSLKFRVQERLQCSESRKVRYSERDDLVLALPIPMEAVTNKEAVAEFEKKKQELEAQKQLINPQDVVRPKISLTACLQAFLADELVEDFYSSALQRKTTAIKSTRLASFPDYLVVQMKKFTVGPDWLPKKLDVSLEMPEELDLSELRGNGLQEGEELLPEGDAPAAAAKPAIDDSLVAQAAETGFPVNACRRAVYNTQNSGLEAAVNWLMEHMEDPDFSLPFEPPGSAATTAATSKPPPDEESLSVVMGMGFTRQQASRALSATDNNLERAVDWIFSHADELDQPMEQQAASEPRSEQQTPAQSYSDGGHKYKLAAFISHMGTSTQVGHYVCHILRDGRWVIFNDEKVALSVKPPKDLGYLYLYERI